MFVYKTNILIIIRVIRFAIAKKNMENVYKCAILRDHDGMRCHCLPRVCVVCLNRHPLAATLGFANGAHHSEEKRKEYCTGKMGASWCSRCILARVAHLKCACSLHCDNGACNRDVRK